MKSQSTLLLPTEALALALIAAPAIAEARALAAFF